jgi:hypothetical protein
MPTIEITEAQQDRLEDVRAELEDHRLGPYGTIRTVDAVEFLLDHYETGVDLTEDSPGDDQRAGRPEAPDSEDEPAGDAERKPEDDAEDEAGTGEDTGADEDEKTDEAEAAEDEDDDGNEEDGQADDDEADGGEADNEADDGEADTDADDDEADNEADDGEADNEADDDEADDDEAGDEAGDEAEEGGDSSGRLNAMMQLLDEHDDKWEESDSENGKYDVTLPEGTTESVRTKDDVRALLFKHY